MSLLKQLAYWAAGILGVVVIFAIIGVVAAALWAVKMTWLGEDPVESLNPYDPYDFPEED